MIIKTIFSGFGGQGVMMMGTSLAHSAMSKGYQVTYLPAYGAEMRGGTANCTVAVSDEDICLSRGVGAELPGGHEPACPLYVSKQSYARREHPD